MKNMKKIFGICAVLITMLLLGACAKPVFNGSRTGNDSQFIMEYEIFNTTDEHSLVLEAGDVISAEVVVDGGNLSVKIQKDNQSPVYEKEHIKGSEKFDVEISESETYRITVRGEETKGSVSFEKVAGEKEKLEKEIDLNETFQGLNGCAVIYSPAQEEYLLYREEMCRQEKSPYSTFKIISALSGLQNGIVSDETSTMGYDGTVYANSEWNEDLMLKDAFQKSCIWYFRKIIDSVGNEKMQEELDGLQYGNRDISQWKGSNINPMEQLNGFWLESSLKISPLQQVEVLAKIFEGRSDYDSRNIGILKRIMLVEENAAQQVYGKTGSNGNGAAWFVGFSEAKGERKYFAIYLEDDTHTEQISGSKAKEIALQIVNER